MREQLKVYLVTGRYDFSDTEFITLFITLQRKPFFIKPVHSIFLYRIISGYTYP